MTARKCNCCGEKPATTRVPHIGRVCDECVELLDQAHLQLSNATLGLSGCDITRPEHVIYEH